MRGGDGRAASLHDNPGRGGAGKGQQHHHAKAEHGVSNVANFDEGVGAAEGATFAGEGGTADGGFIQTLSRHADTCPSA